VAARQSAPVIGDLCSSNKEQLAKALTRKHGLDVSIGYRYQPSSRHFIGTDEQTQRELANNQIENVYHLMDVSVTYRLNRRWSLTGSLPIVVARRDQLYAPSGTYRAAGIGDMTIGARTWIFRPPTESGGNVAVGFSLKLPTGNDQVSGMALDRNGKPVLAVADQSIQLGDGGWGFALDMQAFRRTYFHSTLYFSGSYLFNPTDTNGVPTFRTRPFEGVMSVSDQYLYRGGISHAVPKIRGLVVSIGGRIEGVPVRDAFGASNGFRRPGYAISVDPGFLYSFHDYVFACNIPWAVERNRRISVPDRKNNSHGDAAFADYAITLGVTRHF
jgi:hypothetical protein